MRTSKRISLAVIPLLSAVMLFTAVISVFAYETQSVTLKNATVGEYYEQYIDIDLVLEKITIPDEYKDKFDPEKASIYDISYDEDELPPGLKIENTAKSAKLSGIPETAGTYTFKVTVIGAYEVSYDTPMGTITTTVPFTDMPVDINATITVLPGEAKPTEPVFTTKPTTAYSVPTGSSITVPVAASCADGCKFELYMKRSGAWSLIESKTGVMSWEIKPLDSAGVNNTIGSHQFKIVAINAVDTSLKSECLFTVEVLQKAPSTAVIAGNTQVTEGDYLALVCTSDGADLTYQWQIKTSGSTSWQIVGKNESTLSIEALLSHNGAEVRCTVSNSAGSKTSSAVTLKVSELHSCSFDKVTVIRKATCTVDGEEKLECTCGKFQTRTIKAEGHKFSEQWTIETQPGCVTPGLKSHRCTVCEEQTDKTAIDPKGHSYGDWKVVKEATTTSEGLEQRICGNCNNVEERTIAKIINGHVHSFSDWTVVKDATCTEAGLRKKSCSCGAVETEAIGAKGHSFSTEYTIISDVTCTEAGTKSRKCTKCNAETDKTAIPAKGHTYGEWKVFKEATTESEGEERRSCSSCNNYESKTIAKLVAGHTHSFGEWMVVNQATCEEAGLEMHVCSCGSAETRQISPKGHSFDAWKLIVSPTKESEGIEIRTCLADSCKKSESRILDKLPEGADTAVSTPTPTETPDTTTSPVETTPQTDTPATIPSGNTVTPSDDDENELLKYLLIGGGGLIGGVIIVFIIITLTSRKKSRWE